MSIKSRFCPECGKETETLIDSLCSDCYSGKPNVKIPNQKNVLLCVKCDQVFNRGFWTKGMKTPEEYLKERLENSIKLPDGERLISTELLEVGKEGIVRIVSKRENKKLIREVKGKFEIKKYCCPVCSRESGVDYTAKLQLRSNKNPKKFVEEALEYIKAASPKIAKVESVLRGADILLVNQHIAKNAARRIMKHFNCSIKQSVRNYGWDTEKDKPKGRITILLKQK